MRLGEGGGGGVCVQKQTQGGASPESKWGTHATVEGVDRSVPTRWTQRPHAVVSASGDVFRYHRAFSECVRAAARTTATTSSTGSATDSLA
jgi:hypothetical protein